MNKRVGDGGHGERERERKHDMINLSSIKILAVLTFLSRSSAVYNDDNDDDDHDDNHDDNSDDDDDDNGAFSKSID